MPNEYLNDLAYQQATGGPLIYNDGSATLIQPDFSKALIHIATLTGNAIIGQPVFAPPAGTTVVITLIQDATGSRSVTWDPCYRDPPSWGSSGPANSRASERLYYDGLTYQCVGGSSTFAVATQVARGLTAALALAGNAPIVVATTGVTITPSVGALSVAGVAPGFQRNTIVSITPTVGAIAVAGVAGTMGLGMVPLPGAVTLAGQAAGRSP